MKTIGMLGMGKLGLPCLMAMEAKGYSVIGYDPVSYTHLTLPTILRV